MTCKPSPITSTCRKMWPRSSERIGDFGKGPSGFGGAFSFGDFLWWPPLAAGGMPPAGGYLCSLEWLDQPPSAAALRIAAVSGGASGAFITRRVFQ